MRILYTVNATISRENVCEIVLDVDDFPEDSMNVAIPAWVPGSYTIRDYAGSVREFSAETASGEPLPVRKKDKSTWSVSGTKDAFVRIKYRIYSGELVPQKSHIDDSHVYLLGASAFVYIDGYREQSSEIEIRAPEGASVITSLEDAGHHRYRATHYDVLADSIIEIGSPQVSQFSVEGKEHRLVFCSSDPVDLKKITGDVRKIVEAARDIFQYLPYKNYTFLFHIVEGSNGGGHEHSSSCSIVVRKDLLGPAYYNDFMNVVAHEFFHAYNVKRIRPSEFEKFNYSRENYTSLLWFSEGLTSYYSEILITRAGLVDENTYMERLSDSIRLYEIMPGRKAVSASESSFDAWIRLYKSSSDDLNTYISYYAKGALIGAFMNIRILQYTSGQKCLDDVMRILWEHYRKDGKGFGEKELLSALKEVSGNDFTQFMEKYVNGTENIDFDAELDTIGYSLSKQRYGDTSASPGRRSAGIVARNEGGRFKVVTPLKGFPAYGSGIAPGDEIVSFDDIPFNSESTAKVVPKFPSSPVIDLLPVPDSENSVSYRVIRRGRIREYTIEVTDPPYEKYKAEKSEDEKKKRLMEKYLLG